MQQQLADGQIRHSSFDIRHSFAIEPPERGVVGLPYGWLPILISSLLFALAHFGYGPEPVPLFCPGPDSRLRLPADAPHHALAS